MRLTSSTGDGATGYCAASGGAATAPIVRIPATSAARPCRWHHETTCMTCEVQEEPALLPAGNNGNISRPCRTAQDGAGGVDIASGIVIPSGTVIPSGIVIPSGTVIPSDSEGSLPAGLRFLASLGMTSARDSSLRSA